LLAAAENTGAGYVMLGNAEQTGLTPTSLERTPTHMTAPMIMKDSWCPGTSNLS
jgi:hypothetical protein